MILPCSDAAGWSESAPGKVCGETAASAERAGRHQLANLDPGSNRNQTALVFIHRLQKTRGMSPGKTKYREGKDMTGNEVGLEFGVQRIYVKDISFESPRAPEVFKEGWGPQVNMELRTKNSELEKDLFEVSIELSIQAKKDDKNVFMIEIEQAGIFVIKGVEGEEKKRVLATFCPNFLFPYAREVVDSLAAKGSFPPLMLAPINFDALYEQEKAKQG